MCPCMLVPALGSPLASAPQGATTTPCRGCRAAQAGRDPTLTALPMHRSSAGPGCSSFGTGRILLRPLPARSLWPDAPVLPGCGVPAHGASSCCLPAGSAPGCLGTTSHWLQLQEQRGASGERLWQGLRLPWARSAAGSLLGKLRGPQGSALTLVPMTVCPSYKPPAWQQGSCALPMLLLVMYGSHKALLPRRWDETVPQQQKRGSASSSRHGPSALRRPGRHGAIFGAEQKYMIQTPWERTLLMARGSQGPGAQPWCRGGGGERAGVSICPCCPLAKPGQRGLAGGDMVPREPPHHRQAPNAPIHLTWDPRSAAWEGLEEESSRCRLVK